MSYEISLWANHLRKGLYWIDDENVYLADSNIQLLTDSNTDYLVTAAGLEFKKEVKLCVIGADNMQSLCKAIEPNLVKNQNGTNSFTFKMYYEYVDTQTGEKFKNPFLGLLVDERPVKVKWQDQWYDFVIKKCQEDSAKRTMTYTCSDAFVEELSRTGFNLEFDDELENNQGRASELGARVVDGTDWKVISEDGHVLEVVDGEVTKGAAVSGLVSDLLQEELEEPVYECITQYAISVKNQTTMSSTSVSIPVNSKILVFYNQIANLGDSGTIDVQLLYVNGEYTTEKNSQLVNNADCYKYENVNYTKIIPENSAPYYQFKKGVIDRFKVYYRDVSQNYRGNRLVQGIQTVYDPLTEKYCDICEGENEGDIIYRFQATDYEEPVIVTNLLTNTKDFSSLDGWIDTRSRTQDTDPVLVFQLHPPLTLDPGSIDLDRTTYLKIENLGTSDYIFNSGLENYSSYLKDGINQGDKLIFRFKLYDDGTFNQIDDEDNSITPIIKEYNPTDHKPLTTQSIQGEYFTVSTVSYKDYDPDGIHDWWLKFTLTCNVSITRSEFFNKHIGFFIYGKGGTYIHWLKEVQLYKEIIINEEEDEDEDENELTPNSINSDNVVNTYYYYYNHSDSNNTKDNIHYLYKGIEPSDTYHLKRHEDSSKFRSISIKESNRFNILQEIAEKFECWVRFYTYHDSSTGEIVYDEDGRPKKYIVFKKEIGKETGLSFEYGIDLNNVRRTVNSDKITTKTIVKTNNNEFAPDGFCTISRSNENYSKANYILNFDYYCSQGLIDVNILTNDLYVPENGATSYSENHDTIGLYYWLHKFNTEYDEKQTQISDYEAAKVKLEANKVVFEDYLTASQQQTQEVLNNIYALSGASTLEGAKAYIVANPDNDTVQNYIDVYYTLLKLQNTYQTQHTQVETAITQIDTTITSLKQDCDNALAQILLVTNAFNRKYWQFLKEGTWSSEEYVDDNLYYLDGVNVAHTAAFPQITYDIQVMRLSSLEEFKGKEFEIGDICSIIDRQYFGYLSDMITPYKEKVIVSEISYFFDEPKKDTIKVQNYKTQFEELFQRITATTQSLQYASGSYAKAAAIVNEDGTIKNDILQSSIDLNKRLAISAQNETVFWDNTGITITDSTNANYRLKITSKGLLISQDGGDTYYNAITGTGINTNLLVAGTIDAGAINILDGAFSTFRWDKRGLNAYDYQIVGDTLTNLDYGKFVRFDRFGIYRIESSDTTVAEFAPTTEESIINNEDLVFSLTSSGFRLRSNDNGRFNITSQNDLQVLTSEGSEMIKIGRLNDNGLYGIRISNSQASSVFETGSDGNVWLRNTLSVGASDSPYVKIGYGSAVRANTTYHEVFSATTNEGNANALSFKVYEDGYIIATGGKIGNMTIDQVQEATYKVVISSSNGFLLKPGTSTTLTATLYAGNSVVTTGITNYLWKKGNESIASGSSVSSIVVNADNLDINAASQYTCIISLNS